MTLGKCQESTVWSVCWRGFFYLDALTDKNPISDGNVSVGISVWCDSEVGVRYLFPPLS